MDYVVNGISDWYLPSAAELALLQPYRGNQGLNLVTDSSGFYWSSTESDDAEAIFQFFQSANLDQGSTAKVNFNRVRPIRAF